MEIKIRIKQIKGLGYENRSNGADQAGILLENPGYLAGSVPSFSLKNCHHFPTKFFMLKSGDREFIMVLLLTTLAHRRQRII